MKPEIKIDIKSAEWKTREEADEQIELLRQLIVNLKGEGVEMDFTAVEEARKARDTIFLRCPSCDSGHITDCEEFVTCHVCDVAYRKGTTENAEVCHADEPPKDK